MAGRAFVAVEVHTFGLEDRLALFTAVQAKRANRSAVSRLGVRGKALVKAKTPVKSGLSRQGIRSRTKSFGSTAVARVYPAGPHAHITRWQDQGTGERHKHSTGQSTGLVEPQYMFERAATELEGQAEAVMTAAIDAALARAGLA